MNNIDEMSVNAIRVLSADAIQKAKSGHPGLPLGAAPALLDGSNIVGLAVKLIDKIPFAKLLEWTLLTVIVIS